MIKFNILIHEEMEKEILIDTEISQLYVIRNFTPDYYSFVKEVFCYEQPEIKVYGKVCHQRRDVAFYSNVSIGYKYSNTLMPSLPLNLSPKFNATNFFEYLLPYVNRQMDTKFNGILVNRYGTGENYISAHSDDEGCLDPKENLVSGISYGAVRTFRIRDKKTKKNSS